MERHKSELHEQYDTMIEEDLDKMIRQVEKTDDESRHKESFKLTTREMPNQRLLRRHPLTPKILCWGN